MIEEIIELVTSEVREEITTTTALNDSNVQQAVQTVSNSIMDKAKFYIDNGKLMELKATFEKGSDEAKQGLIEEAKTEIIEQLGTELQVSSTDAESIAAITIPALIKVSKEKLLGPDGKIGFTDIPKLLAFFKSGGTSTKPSGGIFGSIFGG
ncbi:MAG: hypothetical protein KTR13_05420 [Saprospiraceae bacterium]|nr:hypothetical protein [Saprospiraceae bacterium]